MAERRPAKKTAAKKAAAPLPREGVDDALAVITDPDTVIPPVLDDTDTRIPEALQFTVDTADTETAEIPDTDVVEFSIDGQTLYAIKPTDEQWGVLMSLLSNAATMAERWHAMQKFGSAVLDELSYMYVENRLLDRNDQFGMKTYEKVVTTLIDHFSPKQNRADRRAAARKLAR